MNYLKPQLADSIRIKGLPAFCKEDAWSFTQKVDGHRKLVYVDDGRVTPLNRRGEATELPRPILADFGISGVFAFDGELVGDTFWVFDMPSAAHRVSHADPYDLRRQLLEGLFKHWHPTHVRLLPRANTPEEKVELVKRLIANRAEGVMLNHTAAPYVSGLRSRYLLKCKFIHDVDCVVTDLRTNGKDNLAISLYDGDRLVSVAEVTALSQQGHLAKIGDVVTVQCLYSTNDDRLYQPTRPRIRTDKAPTECTIDQLDAIRVNKEVLAWP